MADELLLSLDGAVRTVTLARPAKRNALNAGMLAGLLEAFSAPPGDEERVAVVRAQGPVFCAGLDLTERMAGPAASLEGVLHAIEGWPLPVVAVVGGDAIAGGAELALHCDLVVASTGARIGMSVAQIGLAPTWPLVVKVLDAAGPALAREILLLGDPVPAPRLADLGVIARVADPGSLEDAVTEVVGRLAANAPLSLRAIKAALVRAMEVRDQLDHGAVDRLIAAAAGSEDAREGMRARLEKRPARFAGR